MTQEISLLDLCSDLQEKIIFNLSLMELNQYCRVNKFILDFTLNPDLMERYVKVNYAGFYEDYIKLSSENTLHSSIKTIKQLTSIFDYSLERLCRLAGRNSNLALYLFYIKSLGWNLEAFNNFIDGLIDQNYNKVNSSKAQEILNYILTKNNIEKFVLKGDNYGQIRREIKIKIQLHKYVVLVHELFENEVNTNEQYINEQYINETHVLPSSELILPKMDQKYINSRVTYSDFNFLTYLASFGIVLTLEQVKYVFNIGKTTDSGRLDHFYVQQQNFYGLLESGKLNFVLTSAFWKRTFTFEIMMSNHLIKYSHSYFNRENLDMVFNEIMQNLPSETLLGLFKYSLNVEDNHILTRIFKHLISYSPEVKFGIHYISTFELVNEFPHHVNFNPSKFLGCYAERMSSSSMIVNEKKPNTLILAKFFELMPQFRDISKFNELLNSLPSYQAFKIRELVRSLIN